MTNEQTLKEFREKFERKCCACHIVQPFKNFVRDKTKKYGINYLCKKCERQRYLEHRTAKLRYFKSHYEANKPVYMARVEKSRHQNKIKINARQRLRYAVKVGKVVKLPCEACGDKNSHGHHSDYSKALEVTWLCRKHHGEAHQIDKKS